MSTNAKNLHQNALFGKGTSQVSRFLRALDPDYVRLDDRSVSELLAYSSEYAELLNYYNDFDNVDGNWKPFLTADVSVVLASIVSTDIKKMEQDHTTLVQTYFSSREEKAKLLIITDQFDDIFAIVKKFDLWLNQFAKISLLSSSFERNIDAEYFNILNEKARENVRQLYAYSKGSKMPELRRPLAFLNDFTKLSSFWKIEDDIEAENIFVGSSLADKLHSAFLKLRILYRSFHYTLTYLVYHFDAYFQKSLKSKQDHKPHVGLFIAFIQLFKNIQDDYNRITDRYLSFYYQRVLRQTPLPMIPDKAHITAGISRNIQRYVLPKNITFSGGLDSDGKDILYEAVRETELTHASIDSIKSVFISRRDDLDTSQFDLVSNIYAAPIANSKDGLGKPLDDKTEPWSLFGEEQEYKPDDLANMIKAEIGWAVASPGLFLKEGERSISVRFEFDPPSTRIYKTILLDIQTRINRFRKENDEPMMSLEDIFNERVFNQVGNLRSFKIFLTSSDGWFEADSSMLGIAATGGGSWKQDKRVDSIDETIEKLNALSLDFKLAKSDPEIIGFNRQLHGESEYQEGIPILKLIINDEKQPFSYSFLRDLSLKHVTIDSKVSRLKDVQLFTDGDRIIKKMNFLPFNVTPSVGSALLISSAELFLKEIKEIRLKIDWKDIPKTVEEFRVHYDGYKEDFHPSFYKIHVSILKDGDFKPSIENMEFAINLFGDGETADEDGLLPPYFRIDKSTLILNEEFIRELQLEVIPDYEEITVYDEDVLDGLIKIELIGPDHAFGHEVFQSTFTDAITNNSRPNREEEKAIPNSPYTPTIAKFELSYKGQNEFQVLGGDDHATERLYHLHPFGVENTYSRGRCLKPQLLPNYDANGYLYLGLNNLNTPESVSIHFQLTNKHSRSFMEYQAPRINWYYLQRNSWVRLDDREILLETTDDFTKSGIIQLQLPRQITKGNSILDSDLYWLKVEVYGDTELLSKALMVQPNGVEVRRVFDENSEPNIIPPGVLNGLQHSVSEVRDVVQHYESFGGKHSEDQFTFFSRIAERLRHKSRGITHWDYERLVINQFEDVYQVKCLSYSTNPLEPEEEKAQRVMNINEESAKVGIKFEDGLSVVVVPNKSHYQDEDTPRFNFRYLEKIEAYLKSQTSPFVKIRVINPVYEYIRVMGKIKFIEGHNNGNSILRLHNDLKSFIAPWLTNRNKKIEIGGAINENVLQDFIKGLSYVRFLTKFSILHIIEEEGIFKLQDTAEEENASVISARPWGIFIPDRDHEFELVDREDEENPAKRIDTDSVIRFQDRINILGMKKYIKIINPTIKIKAPEVKKEEKKNYEVQITL